MNLINDIGVLVGLVVLAAFLISGAVLALADSDSDSDSKAKQR